MQERLIKQGLSVEAKVHLCFVRAVSVCKQSIWSHVYLFSPSRRNVSAPVRKHIRMENPLCVMQLSMLFLRLNFPQVPYRRRQSSLVHIALRLERKLSNSPMAHPFFKCIRLLVAELLSKQWHNTIEFPSDLRDGK